ncbi:A component of insecticidal toxin complex (Tc) [Xenorhabdus nematophila ATCC 19061]|uniref:A component of insecticidal toxin complex (Tc) n=2 Tax=Xenorhabdus nematophila TaxID=628 RepID=D3VHH9_XENNA|nr:neuraminidase-like domain-containing protein [Xenorhabdus nematophila]6RW8_A Chain A, A component of insecticidal toxin complex (Tc) [Xenorhabdus nematophila]6RW8_B Chain B, A component of insecticidal toxin complex (Tc) [Xenorhabdus nematophila]6RW8_C Chain C, A component of insecticidal toxin complex (Tc) [Xenorhabdus nematophila]6RW8_D Chain D, A component of insecticidal toxin complex (Tc) [Xenorhabdus nematophila]6RW8_E Chain E, A component of insecticidal toxin complex (Tc) [Xenorhabd
MIKVNELLDKINRKRSGDTLLLTNISFMSFSEFRHRTSGTLTWRETDFLYQQAHQESKQNKLEELRILSRANPQLANITNLNITPSTLNNSYNSWFYGRAHRFVKPGSIASIFSPAAYLTELYREAKDFHPDNSQYHLNKRRPDIASLALTQNNMDEEISTLSLSNELLLHNIQTLEKTDYNGVMKMLSTYRQTGMTPYHLPYESARQAILLQDKNLTAFSRNTDVAELMDPTSLLAIKTDISPELYQILVEEITPENSTELMKKNFGTDDVLIFKSYASLARYYDLSYDELSLFVNLSFGKKNTNQQYKNEQLITLVNDGNDTATARLIKRTRKDFYDSHLNYAELIPIKENEYKYNFSVKKTEPDHLDFRLQNGDKEYIYQDKNFVPIANTHYSIPIKLTTEQITNGITLRLWRVKPNPSDAINANAHFKMMEFPGDIFLLKLNKAIRLYKATGISPEDIWQVIESIYDDLTIDSNVLGKLFYVQYYMQHYNISVSDALVLCHSDISQYSTKQQPSHFTMLFNTPLLNGQEFSADNTKLDLTPGESKNHFYLGIMKRAFRVNDTELYTLWKLANGGTNPEFMCSIENLSLLYRVRLLADIHHLTVNELSMLLSVSPYVNTKIALFSDTALTQLISFLFQCTQWLTTQKWSVSDVFLMTTDNYSTVLTPDIENLITTLSNGLSTLSLGDDELIRAAAPLIAASIQMDSAKTAETILLWINQIKPQGLTFDDFMIIAANRDRSENETSNMVAFCQVLGQLSLIVRNIGLSENELTLLVTKPEKFQSETTALQHDLPTLQALTRFHAVIMRCGSYATEILTALELGALTAEQLAVALKFDAQVVTQALQQTDLGVNTFTNWRTIDVTLQWLDVAATLGITPDGVAALIKLKYVGEPETPMPTFDDWQAASTLLQAGLNSQQSDQLQAWLDEATTTAASAYYIKNGAPQQIKSRDELYSYLLIDNQVSAQVKTTRVAEAIASIQLYVNRALNNVEGKVSKPVKTRQFFCDWETYNRRYSTWAGVSELAYYPENYIDPTIRIGQTGMMNNLLQQLSQSQLNIDTVEDSFKNYLTAFEDVANLQVISGYHDSINVNEGLTYLIGYSQTEPRIYYWRNVDHQKCQHGQFAANAWGEWKKIEIPINVWQENIRPVIYKSRLYLLWLEQKELKNESEDGKIDITDYILKLSHIRYDGSWSSPFNFNVTDKIENLINKKASIGMYCSSDYEKDVIIVYFHEKKDNYSFNSLPAREGMTINPDMTLSILTENDLDAIVKSTLSELDTRTEYKVNNQFATDYLAEYKESITTKNKLASFTGNIFDLSYISPGNGHINLTFNPSMEINFSKGNIYNDEVKYLLSMVEDETVILFDYDRHDEMLGKEEEVFHYGTLDFIISIDLKNAEYFRVLMHLRTKEKIPRKSEIGVGINYDYESNDAEFKLDTNIVLDWKDNTGVWHTICESFTNDVSIINNMGNIAALFLREDPCVYLCSIATDIKIASSMIEQIQDKNISFLLKNGSDILVELNAEDHVASKPSHESDPMVYDFNQVKVDIEGYDIPLVSEFIIKQPDGGYNDIVIESPIHIKLKSKDTSNVISLHKMPSGTQYMQIGPYRTRLNTLFSRKLAERANIGIDNVLSMETQNLPEPQLGEGFYATFKLPPYNKEEHGDERWFKIHIGNIDGNSARQPYYEGMLSDIETTVTLFVPYAKGYYIREGVRLGVGYKKIIYDKSWESAFFYFDETKNQFIFINDADHDSGMTQQGIVKNIKKYKGFIHVVVMKNNTEPMDFNGANAIYFWELFYYTPMMVFQRLLQEQNFTESTRWLRYIWNPAGYSVQGEMQDYYWNVRPLEEDTSWNANPLDSVDPDAVAQHDPMHYKVATFMKMLDLLITRGDSAYRQLERDTLNEAKMWYVQALTLLGDEPYFSLDNDWSEPRLEEAASQTMRHHYQHKMLQLRQRAALPTKRTANSLTALFLPQINKKLQGYWQTLTQRLYNLRHNLTIDGQPLSLSLYATPADPSMLLSAAITASQGGGDLPHAVMPMYRFPVILENAKWGVSQLIQFGNTLLSITERQDAEALAEILQTQGSELALQSIKMQDKVMAEIDADKLALQESRHGAQSRFDSFNTLYDEDVNAGEKQAMDLYLSSSVLSTSGTALHMAAAAADLVPNIYGFAVGGSRFGALFNASAIGIEISASATRIAADKISQSEIYRRRRQEWEIQRNNAEAEIKQIDAQLATLAVRREAAVLQKNYLETQQAQTQAQLAFLQSKFSNAALYNWLRGRLSAIYYQFYDLAVSLCLMAEQTYQYELNNAAAHFIKPGAWHGTYAGLLAGETLMLNLAQMEKSYLEKDERALEVTRTVSLAEVYAGLTENSFILKDKVTELVNAGEGSAGTTLNGLNVEGTQLQASLKLSDLNIATDYPDGLGNTRRIKQISVTLPALLGPYQDVRAILSYGGSTMMPRGCKAIAISHGMNDSGQFQMDFNDAKYLPFEGLPVADTGTLTLSFPGISGKQKSLLLSLSDIILHIRYTIRS